MGCSSPFRGHWALGLIYNRFYDAWPVQCQTSHHGHCSLDSTFAHPTEDTRLSWLQWLVTNQNRVQLQIVTYNNKSSRKSFGKSHVATPRGREWTRPLCVLAVQCPLQTSPITQPPVCYIHTTQMDTWRYLPAFTLVPSYTARWQRHTGVNNLLKVVTRQCSGRDLNLRPLSCKFNALSLDYQATCMSHAVYK